MLTIAVPILGDVIDEGDTESFTVVLNGATGATLGTPTAHAVVIQDNDPLPTLSVADTTVAESAGSVVFTVTLTGPTARQVGVNYAVLDGTALAAAADYTPASGTLTFEAGTTTQSVAVALANDGWTEPTETLRLQLAAPVNATITDDSAEAAILDDDGTYVPLDPTLPGVFLADADGGPDADDYVLVGNPQGTPVTARLTITLGSGSGVTRDIPLAAYQRQDVPLALEPGVSGQRGASVAVQALTPGTAVDADHSVYWGTNWTGGRSTEGVTPATAWYFAEGSVGYFEEYLAVYNLEDQAIDVRFEFFLASGDVVVRTAPILAGPGRLRVRVRDWLGAVDHGTQVTAVRLDTGAAARIVAERTMEWEDDRREGHSSPGVSALSTTWWLAEGSSGGFDTYVALLNPSAVTATATLTYRDEEGVPFPVQIVVPAHARATVLTPTWVPSPYAISVVSDAPLAAERLMYGGTTWAVGTAGVGAASGATTWRFAEGATGSAFDTYFTAADTSGLGATVTFTFTTATGAAVGYDLVVPPGARRAPDRGPRAGTADGVSHNGDGDAAGGSRAGDVLARRGRRPGPRARPTDGGCP